MASFSSSRYTEIEPARVQHGRTFVTNHHPPSTTPIATHTRMAASANGSQRASLPTKNVTLSTSNRNLNASLNSSLNLSHRSNGNGNGSTALHNNSTRLNSTLTHSNNNTIPINSTLLHPNHIHDVFPDALSALSKGEEHTYSGSAHNATYEQQQQHHQHIHTNGHTHEPNGANAQNHHKIPLRMPIGPNVSQAPQITSGGMAGNLFDPINMSGMDDSYANVTSSSGSLPLPSATPHLSSALSSDRVAPLQRENLRLVRSNNTLQAHLIAEGERIDECERNWAQEMRTIKTKHADLQFLHAQKTRKIANQEQKISELQSRLEQVLSDRQAYVKESIEAPSRLTSAPITPLATFKQPQSDTTNRVHIDAVKALEGKVTELQRSLDESLARESQFTSIREVLEKKVATRDDEVKRLSEVLESERNWDKMHVEFELKRHIKTITKLEGQIDFLNTQRIEWEKDIASFREMGVSANYMEKLYATQNEMRQVETDYAKSLEEIQSLKQQLQTQQSTIDTFEQRKLDVNQQAQVLLEQRNRDIVEMERRYENLSKENEQRQVSIERLTTQLEATRAKVPNIDVTLLQENFKREEQGRLALREQYTKLVKENDELVHKYNQTANELSLLKDSSSRDLSTLQSDLLRAQYLNEDFQRRLKDLADSRATLSEESGVLKTKVELNERMKEGMGGERDYYKQQVHELNQEIHQLKLDLQQKSDTIQLLDRKIVTQEALTHETSGDRSKLLHEQQKDHATIRSLENQIHALQEDLSAARHQNANLNEIVVERQQILNNVADMNVTQRGLVRTNEKMKIQIEALSKEKETLFDRLKSVTSERDSLMQSLSSTDTNLIGIQDEITKLHQERELKEDQYAALYHDYTAVSEQFEELRTEKLPALQNQLSSTKVENDRLQSMISNLQEGTVSKLYQTEQFQKQEILNLKKTCTELQKKLDLETEHVQQAEQKLTSLEHELHTLRQTTTTKQSQLTSNATLLSHHTDLIAKLNLQVSDLKGMCRTLEGQKLKLETEWKLLTQQYQELQRDLNQQVDLHTNQSLLLQSKSQEVIELKSSLNALSETKASLEIELHATQQRSRELENDLRQRSNTIGETQGLLQENEAHSSLLQETLRSKEYEMTELLQQIQQLQRDRTKLSDENTLKNTDLKAILIDLENVIKENQVLTRELSLMKTTVDTRATDIERLASRLTHTEEQYKSKELECLDLLSNYRVVCLENERMKVASDELEQERASHRLTLKQQQDALFKQDAQIRGGESELRKRMVDIQSLEHTIQELSRSLESQKKATDAMAADKNDVLQQLDAARALAGGMEQSRSEHMRVLAEYKSQLQKTQQDLHAIQLDNTHLIHTLQQSKEHGNNLDKVIATLRGRSALQSEQHAVNIQEKNVRIGQLQQEIQHVKIQLESLTEQVQTLNEYRDKQNGEINRLLQSDSSSSLSSSGRHVNHSDLLNQIKSLQAVIDSQFLKLQDLQKEKSKLKSYIVKYEAELRTWEQRNNNKQPQQQSSPPGNGAVHPHPSSRTPGGGSDLSGGGLQTIASPAFNVVDASVAASFRVENE